MGKIIFFLLIVFVLTGCGFQSRRQELDEREKKLAGREQAILLKEKELQLLEDSLKRNLAQKDTSALLALTSIPLPDSLAGTWEVSMLCTRTNCQGFAVGDTRKESWLFAQRDEAVSVSALQGEKLVRVYTGSFNGSGFRLMVPPNVADSAAAAMTVMLKVDNINKMSGERVITQADGCSSVFKIDATRSANTPK
ncbi:hypothetical protein [Niabella aquatica]